MIAARISGGGTEFNFHAVINGNPEFPRRTFLNVSKVYEDGVALTNTGFRADTLNWVLRTDVGSSAEQQSLMVQYKEAVGSIVTLERLSGGGTQNFSPYKIIDVRDITDETVVALAAGGVSGGTFILVSSWMLEYMGVNSPNTIGTNLGRTPTGL
jgi:hypothetical protein